MIVGSISNVVTDAPTPTLAADTPVVVAWLSIVALAVRLSAPVR